MALKDLSNAWEAAAERARLNRGAAAELDCQQLVSAAGLRTRTGLVAGGGPIIDPTDECPEHMYTIDICPAI